MSHSSLSCVPRRAAPCAPRPDDEDEGEEEPTSVVVMVAAGTVLLLLSFWMGLAPGGREGNFGEEREGENLRAGGVGRVDPCRTGVTREPEAAFGIWKMCEKRPG